jgi:hypothetical protein
LNAFFPKGYFSYLDFGWGLAVKRIDARCLLAEASLVGPPQAMDHLPAFGFKGDNDQLFNDQRVLNRQLARGAYLGIPPVTYPQDPTDHPGVEEYIGRVLELL